MKNQVLKILLPNEPNGLKIVGLAGWSGQMFIIPRNQLKQIKARPEVNNPGVYFLFGFDAFDTSNVYIGESESFLGRLETHESGRDYWNVAVVFTGGLDRADVKFLENKSTLLAKESKRYEVLNKVQPGENKLDEFKKITVDDYFTKIEYLLNVFGYPIFKSVEESASDVPLYYLKVSESKATGRLLDNGDFIVYKDSQARIKETPSFTGFAQTARRIFAKDGTFNKVDENSYIFKKDSIFKSPSTAAATVGGRSINGWTAWKDRNGKTLDENVRK